MDLDADACGNDNFYDEIASFMLPSGDYTLDDLDEILRSTDSQLDSSIDLNTFVPHHTSDFELPRLQTDLESQRPQDDFNFSFAAFPSPATTNQSSSAYNTPPYESQRNSTSSSSSMEDDEDDDDDDDDDDSDDDDDDNDNAAQHFNPDEFINFLNDDDIKLEEINRDTIMLEMDESGMSQHDEHHRQRNTPSPTGSCTSSSGSSTSGVQSDASSTYMEAKEEAVAAAAASEMHEIKIECPFTMPAPPAPISQQPAIVSMPIVTLPVLPTTATTILQTLPQVHSILPGTLLPVKTLPLTSVTHLKTPTLQMAPKSAIASAPTIKVVTSSNAAAASNTGKITPPTNSKPKTIFLSSNDFKTLMQKMNTNGKGGGAKITGGINGQVPKIIMKTANGKVITANKIVQPVAASSHHVQQHFVPKIVKTSHAATGPLMVKQQQLKLSSSNLHTNVIRSGPPQDRSVYRGLIDEKMFKKQQRMIKNRESASLSRKKKKEYVVSLESRINNLEKENYTLKGENTSLRSQLVAFAQTCHCKHSNISDFILNSLNVNAKEAGITTTTLTTNNSSRSGQHHNHTHHHHNHPHHSQHHQQQHVKIAPKPTVSNGSTTKSLKQRMSATSVKKNVAVLFAMAFMVTLNVGNFQTYLNKNSIESALEQHADAALAAAAEQSLAGAASSSGRRLLWVESESEFSEKLNRSKRETELLEVPPLHFLRPSNRSGSAESDEPPPPLTLPNTKCGSSTSAGSFNQTENQRLASNLHKWIGGNDYLNLSLHDNKYGNDNDDDNELDNSGNSVVGFKLTPDYFELKSIDLPLQGPGPAHGGQKRKLFIQGNHPHLNDNKQPRKMELTDSYDDDGDEAEPAGNSLGLFKPTISDEYLRLFKGIKRQDDTFYVVSFNSNNLLLPASAYNKSARPKMSLMMPASDPSLNGDIVLMQIDCEVVNTTEVELKSHMIPEKLRPSKFTHTPNPNDVANNETGGGGGGAGAHKRSQQMPPPSRAAQEANTKEKQRPTPVRTYFMMGPKNQAAAAAALKRKPTIVKLSGNESFVASSGVGNVRNSTLYAKMRETVEGETTQFTSG